MPDIFFCFVFQVFVCISNYLPFIFSLSLLFSIPISPTPCFHFFSPPFFLSLSPFPSVIPSHFFFLLEISPSPHRLYFPLLLSPFSLWYLGQILACQQISDWSVIKSFLFCFLQSLMRVLSSISLLLIV